jgi:hypothetical protein
MWIDNDLIVPHDFVAQGLAELRERRLDFLVPYSSVRYLSEADSTAVIQGDRSPADCRPVNEMHAGRGAAVCFGGMGLVRRAFLQRHGGLIEGFRGWGGEDNAWNRKVSLLGRAARTARPDRFVHHLYHPSSGGYRTAPAGDGNPTTPITWRCCAACARCAIAPGSPRRFRPRLPPPASSRSRTSTTMRPPRRARQRPSGRIGKARVPRGSSPAAGRWPRTPRTCGS